MIIDGLKVNYIDEGTGDAVLFLHGWGSNYKCFTDAINLAKKNYRVIALDLPGFGETDMMKTAWCVDDYTDFIIKFLTELKVTKIILIGHSYGGRIIIKLNSRKDLPFAINKNILIDAAGLKEKHNLKTSLKINMFKFIKNIVLLLPLNDKEKILDNMRNKFGSSDYKNSSAVLKGTLVKSVNEDLSIYLPNMKETLLIWGDNDTATPIYMAYEMEKNIQNAGLVKLHGGHFSFIEDRFTFLKVLASYLKIML